MPRSGPPRHSAGLVLAEFTPGRHEARTRPAARALAAIWSPTWVRKGAIRVIRRRRCAMTAGRKSVPVAMNRLDLPDVAWCESGNFAAGCRRAAARAHLTLSPRPGMPGLRRNVRRVSPDAPPAGVPDMRNGRQFPRRLSGHRLLSPVSPSKLGYRASLPPTDRPARQVPIGCQPLIRINGPAGSLDLWDLSNLRGRARPQA